jgi:hypothetical protein
MAALLRRGDLRPTIPRSEIILATPSKSVLGDALPGHQPGALLSHRNGSLLLGLL